jgi:TrmH family RNA methyltransferase
MALSASQIKQLQSLKLKKNRKALGVFVAEGEKVVNELIASGLTPSSVYTTTPIDLNLPEERIVVISEKTLGRISHFNTPNKLLAVFPLPKTSFQAETAKEELIMVLDQINDPGNMGTLIRIADWFGIRHVICSEGCADPYQPKVVQASMGSIAHVQLYTEHLPALFEQYTEKIPPVYGAVLDGTSIYDTPLENTGFLVFGNESHGISKAVESALSHRITIPAYGKAESLNVAAAAAVVCAAFRKENK